MMILAYIFAALLLISFGASLVLLIDQAIHRSHPLPPPPKDLTPEELRAWESLLRRGYDPSRLSDWKEGRK